MKAPVNHPSLPPSVPPLPPQIEQLLQSKCEHQEEPIPYPRPLPPQATPTGNDFPVHPLCQTAPTGSNSLPIHPLLAQHRESRVQLPPDPESPVTGDGEESPSPLANGWRKPASGLSSLAERYLGKPLDKSQQLSDWERRPLRKEQMRYAGDCVQMICNPIQ